MFFDLLKIRHSRPIKRPISCNRLAHSTTQPALLHSNKQCNENASHHQHSVSLSLHRPVEHRWLQRANTANRLLYTFSNDRSAACKGRIAYPCLHRRSFSTNCRLLEDTRRSHKSTHACPYCQGSSFESASALEDHIRAKHAKKTKNEQAQQKATPLDIFFQIYEKESGFKYNRASNPSAAFRALRRHMRWSDDDSNYEYAKLRYRAALNDELKVWFGSGDDLGSWHALCRAVGIAPLPRDGGGCQTALRGKQVNLVDLVEWARADGGEEETVRVFRDVSELRRYTRSTRRYFPLVDVESSGVDGDGDVVIRHLLRRINS